VGRAGFFTKDADGLLMSETLPVGFKPARSGLNGDSEARAALDACNHRDEPFVASDIRNNVAPLITQPIEMGRHQFRVVCVECYRVVTPPVVRHFRVASFAWVGPRGGERLHTAIAGVPHSCIKRPGDAIRKLGVHPEPAAKALAALVS
jgi:hypothetical protein